MDDNPELQDLVGQIEELEKKDQKDKKVLKKNRDILIKSLEIEISRTEEDRVLFFSFSSKASTFSQKTRIGEPLTPQEELDSIKIIKTAYLATSYENTSVLDEAIKHWIRQSAFGQLENFMGGGKPRKIAVAFSQFFYDPNYSVEFWEGVSNVYGQEAVWRSQVLDRLYQQLILLRTIETWFSQTPDGEKLKQLKEEYEKAQEERAKLSSNAQQTFTQQEQAYRSQPQPEITAGQPQNKNGFILLEEISQDQARRRNIPIEQARQMVWETLHTTAVELDIQGYEITTGTTSAPVINRVLSTIGINQQAKLLPAKDRSPEFDEHMNRIVQRAENRPFDIRREPDKVLLEQLRGIFQQVFRQNPTAETFQEEVIFWAWAKTETPNYSSSLENYYPTYQLRRSVFSPAASWIRQYAQDYAVKGVKFGVKKIGGENH